MNTGRIGFIGGLDSHSASPPDGFPFRWAALTWYGSDEGSVDPWPLMRAVVPRIATALGADRVIAEQWRRERKGLLQKWKDEKIGEVDWKELMKQSDAELEQNEFPSRMCFMKGETPVLCEESEMWSLVGGPAPYHDSVTLSFFSAMETGDTLQPIFEEEAGKLGWDIVDVEAPS